MGFPLLRRVLQNGGAMFCRSRCLTYSSYHRRISENGEGGGGGGAGAGAGYCNSGAERRSSVIINNNCSPLLMLPPLFDESNGNTVYNFHSLAHKEDINYGLRRGSEELPWPEDVEFAGSSHGWVALYNWINQDVFLWNPITNRHIKLPSLSTLHDPKIKFTVTGGGRGISRVALSCSPEGEGCRVMVIVGEARRLAFCVPGHSTKWHPIGDRNINREYDDVVYSIRHKLFFCITRFTTELELEGWNVGDPLSPRIDWMVRQSEEGLKFDCRKDPWPSRPSLSYVEAFKRPCWHLKYLVFAERTEELFLVVRHVNPRLSPDGSYACSVFYSKYRGFDRSYPYKTMDFDVYKIDGGKLRYMDTSLEGLAMFLGINESYAVSASEFPELKPDTIYFADENRHELHNGSFADNQYRGHDNGIFNYQTKTFSACCAHCPLNPLDYRTIKKPLDYLNSSSSSINKKKKKINPPLWFAPSFLGV